MNAQLTNKLYLNEVRIWLILLGILSYLLERRLSVRNLNYHVIEFKN